MSAGGENVYCGEVEAVIFNHPAVREVAVFGIRIWLLKQKASCKCL
jgi:acyl-CoA synthetase (AMP-forming)/AMP-acid ligase II